MDNIALLLTGTIYPEGKIYTKLLDPELRKEQYISAIEFYLENTELNIVFCENTNNKIFNEIKNFKKFKRLEYITFNGNKYNNNLGKSYGEAKIIMHALQYSKFLKDVQYIIKITGRVKVLNIKNIIDNIKKLKINTKNIILTEFPYYNYAKSVCFITSKNWMFETINRFQNLLNDEKKFNFEKMLFRSILSTPSIKIKKLFAILDGISGTEGTPYPNYSLPQLNLNHYNTLFKLYLEKKDFFRFIFTYILWLYFIPIRKLHNYINSSHI